ncbi:MAG: T9SS type A sorting domain-containing protein [Ignavibacteriaceae bacterium]
MLIVFGSFIFYASSTGVTGVTMKNSNPGCTCHSSAPSSLVSVTIEGPDEVQVNGTATYTVTISGGPLVRGGTNIAVSAGTLTPAGGSGLRVQENELTHSLPKNPEGGVVSFEFTYMAPDTEGEQTIYAVGNSVNSNGQNTQDQWNFAPNKVITVTGSTTDVEDENIVNTYKLNQNYPNPFNPSTQINFSVAEAGNVQLVVYDMLGNEVETLVNDFRSPGNYNVNFSSTGLSSGVYLYKLITNNFVETKKMILAK